MGIRVAAVPFLLCLGLFSTFWRHVGPVNQACRHTPGLHWVSLAWHAVWNIDSIRGECPPAALFPAPGSVTRETRTLSPQSCAGRPLHGLAVSVLAWMRLTDRLVPPGTVLVRLWPGQST